MNRVLPALSLLLTLAIGLGAASLARATPNKAIDWQSWSPTLFERAQQQEQFVFLYLEAVWCHWCHVMQQKTFTDAKVQALLDRHYVVSRVDHDAHPALANRYRDWGWPALIFFGPDGTEIVKRAGYIAPGPFARLLKAIVDDPSPEAAGVAAAQPDDSKNALLSESLRATLRSRHRDAHDEKRGGLDTVQKFMDRDSVEYAMARAAAGDEREAARARRSLDAALALIDPAWGGAYQYSTGGNWQNPHFEKIMRTQAGMLRIYARAYAQFGDPAYLDAARAIRGYLLSFLRDPASGAFYVSQDADLIPGQKAHDYFALDDQARRARGMPAIDKSRYALHNGLAIHALVHDYAFTGEQSALDAALGAARWAVAERGLPEGGFRHGAESGRGPFLGDSLHMGRALLALYEATGERQWLTRSAAAADFVMARFRREGSGFRGAVADGTPVAAIPDIDENIAAARWLNRLHHFTGDPDHAGGARHAMRFLAAKETALARITDAGILLADQELRSAPLHLTVVGPKGNETTRALLQAALATPRSYRRVELWDPAAGKLPNHDVNYPNFERPAGYVCNDGRCSAPSFNAERYAQQIRRLAGPTE